MRTGGIAGVCLNERPSTRPSGPARRATRLVNMAFLQDKNCVLLIPHNIEFPVDSGRRPRAPPPNSFFFKIPKLGGGAHSGSVCSLYLVGQRVPLLVICLILNFNIVKSRSMTNYINNSAYCIVD